MIKFTVKYGDEGLSLVKEISKTGRKINFKTLNGLVSNSSDASNITSLVKNSGDKFVDYADEMVEGFGKVKFDVSSSDFLRSISHSWGKHYKDWIKLGYKTEDKLAKAVKEIVEKGLKGDPSVRVGIQHYLKKEGQYFFVKETGTSLGDIFIPFTKIGEPVTGFIRKNVWIGRDTKIVEWILELFN